MSSLPLPHWAGIQGGAHYNYVEGSLAADTYMVGIWGEVGLFFWVMKIGWYEKENSLKWKIYSPTKTRDLEYMILLLCLLIN